MTGKPERTAFAIFVVGSVLAGGNAVGVRFSNRELDPFWGATVRFTLAAVLMLGVMAATRRRFPTGRSLAGAVLYGLFGFGGAFALAFYALVELEAGFGQIVLSVVPLVTLVIGVPQRLERLTAAGIVGAALAILGVVVLSGLTLDDGVPIVPILAAVGSAVCFAQASLTVRRFPVADPVVLNAVGMSAGAVFLAAVTALAGDEVALPSLPETWIAIGYMVIVGSGVVFTLYVILLRYWNAARANYSFVLIPVFTLIYSAVLLDEQIDSGLIAGGLLVVAGVYVGALRRRHLDPMPAET
jgi:drug/metabolite transporter (DMT)-like permease